MRRRNRHAIARAGLIAAVALVAAVAVSQALAPSVLAAAPAADAGGPYTIAEGESLTLDGSLSDDPDGDTLDYRWDLDGDGGYGDAVGPTPTVAWEDLRSRGIDDDGVHPIALRVDDGTGGTDIAATEVTVLNTPPTITLSGAPESPAGAAYTLTLGVDDPGAETILGWTINWGDGAIDRIPGSPATATHIYHRTGMTFPILAAVRDGDGTFHQNDLVVTGYDGDRLFRFERSTGAFVTSVATTGVPVEPIVGPDGYIYVGGEATNTVMRHDGSSLARLGPFVASGAGGLRDADGLAFGADGNLYVADWNGNQVLRFDGETGAFIDVFADTEKPYDLVFGPDGHLYVGGYNTSDIIRFDGETGVLIDVFVPERSGGLHSPEQFAFGPEGHLYVASFRSDEVLRFDGATGDFIDIFVPAGGTGGLDAPGGLAFGPDGDLYVGDYDDHLVLRFEWPGGDFIDEFVAPGAGGLEGPGLMAFLPELQVTVTAPNRPPVLDPVFSGSVLEQALVAFVATATDPDGDGLTFSLAGAVPAGAAIDPISGVFTWTPTEVQGPGAFAFEVLVTDDGGPPLTDSRVVSLDVTEQNRPPALVYPGMQTTTEGLAVALTIAATDPDLPANLLTWDANGLPPGLGIDPATGQISGTISAGASALSPFSVLVGATDDGTPNLVDTTGFLWVVEEPPAPPTTTTTTTSTTTTTTTTTTTLPPVTTTSTTLPPITTTTTEPPVVQTTTTTLPPTATTTVPPTTPTTTTLPPVGQATTTTTVVGATATTSTTTTTVPAGAPPTPGSTTTTTEPVPTETAPPARPSEGIAFSAAVEEWPAAVEPVSLRPLGRVTASFVNAVEYISNPALAYMLLAIAVAWLSLKGVERAPMSRRIALRRSRRARRPS